MVKRSSLYPARPETKIMVLLGALLMLGSQACRKENLKDESKSQETRALSEVAPENNEFNLSAPTEEEFIQLQTLFGSMQLGRVTQIADAFSNGYHSGNSFASEADQAVDQAFFEDLWAGNYNKIEHHMGAYEALAGQGKAVALARMGFLNVWKFAERYRLQAEPGPLPPEVQGALGPNLGACAQYFEAAEGVAPQNAVYKGFAASCQFLNGLGPDGPASVLKAFKTSQTAIKLNPEFNLFTIGYILTFFPHDSQQFQLGLEMFFRNLELCFDGKVDRENPDVSKLMPLFVSEGNKKYCANSEKAPYNFEGFFLILGDLLVKNGQVDAAITAYNTSKALPSYGTWPYAAVLEARIAAADQLVTAFRAPVDPMVKPDYPTTTFNTEYACMACHQKQ